MDRSQKADAVAQLNAVFNEVSVVVVTRNLGMTVAQSTDLRNKMRNAGASYKVAKNRLAKLALKDTDYVGLDELRAKLVGLVNAPATKIAQVVTAPAAKVARVFGAYAAKDAA